MELRRGETLGLVGESGSGKSTLARAITRLMPIDGGEILLGGTDIARLPRHRLRAIRKRVQMVFQDPYASLDPRQRIIDIIAEGPIIHGTLPAKAREEAQALLGLVGLDASAAQRFPHEFSGGQRQRIGIARALAADPDLIICDEAVSALDVSVKAQIVNLLQDLQERLGLAYIFISHDLSVVRHVSDDIAVMYLGKIVELAGKEEIYAAPAHPYTKSLMSAVPVPDPDIEAQRQRIILKGDLPNPADPPSGCRFRTRCPVAIAECATVDPMQYPLAPGHWAKCIRLAEKN
jgi:oligopeptide/dipeptide ABC transporter ATP-binding protein